MGKNANGDPFEERKFYTHTETGRIIQLFRDAAGFREVENGKNINIFNLSKGDKYRPSTQEDFQTETKSCDQRKAWLTQGLQQLTEKKVPEPNTAQQRHDAMDGEF